MKKLIAAIIFSIIAGLSQAAAQNSGDRDRSRNEKNKDRPIVDSRMTKAEAFEGLDPQCPAEIRNRQRLITVRYYSFDGKVHQGQLVLDKDLVKDVEAVFRVILREHFPIRSVIPISDKRFRKDGRWDDDLSMIADNSSSFNYRAITGGTSLSNHAYGRAIDLNTAENPYIKGNIVLPPGSKYDPSVAGTFAANDPIVKAFLQLGWDWGGNWTTHKDYQHFERPLKKVGE